MRSKIISISLPQNLLEALDMAARASYNSRSGFIRESLALRLKQQRVVEELSEEDELRAIFEKAMQAEDKEKDEAV